MSNFCLTTCQHAGAKHRERAGELQPRYIPTERTCMSWGNTLLWLLECVERGGMGWLSCGDLEVCFQREGHILRMCVQQQAEKYTHQNTPRQVRADSGHTARVKQTPLCSWQNALQSMSMPCGSPVVDRRITPAVCSQTIKWRRNTNVFCNGMHIQPRCAYVETGQRQAKHIQRNPASSKDTQASPQPQPHTQKQLRYGPTCRCRSFQAATCQKRHKNQSGWIPVS
jgi:hypothetical protein